jgi:hypothetical protein
MDVADRQAQFINKGIFGQFANMRISFIPGFGFSSKKAANLRLL